MYFIKYWCLVGMNVCVLVSCWNVVWCVVFCLFFMESLCFLICFCLVDMLLLLLWL